MSVRRGSGRGLLRGWERREEFHERQKAKRREEKRREGYRRKEMKRIGKKNRE